ncbi:hypothetical protein D3C75_532670 [compost metagenome]
MIAQAINEYMKTQVTAGLSNANQASFNTKFNTPEAVLGLKDQVQSVSDQIAKDKAELAATQAMPDEFGNSITKANDIQKRIDNSQATLDALQQLVANNGQVSFKSEEKLVDVLDKLAKRLDSSNPPPPIHQ